MVNLIPKEDTEKFEIHRAEEEQLRFLLNDNAFSTGFLITTVDEYIKNNMDKV